MPNLVTDLIVDRVDLVDEGANSAAFIEFFKRRDPVNMKTPEEIIAGLSAEDAEVLKSANATVEQQLADLKVEKANLLKQMPCTCDGEADENGVCKSCGKTKVKKAVCSECGKELPYGKEGLCDECAAKKAEADKQTEDVMKSLPKEVADLISTLQTQKAAAEDALVKSKEAAITAEATAKAKEMKSLPVKEDELISILKGADKKVVDLLETINASITASVLTEKGKSTDGREGDKDAAWDKIEAEAIKIEKADGCTHQKAIAKAIEANPSLYTEYLEGGN